MWGAGGLGPEMASVTLNCQVFMWVVWPTGPVHRMFLMPHNHLQVWFIWSCHSWGQSRDFVSGLRSQVVISFFFYNLFFFGCRLCLKSWLNLLQYHFCCLCSDFLPMRNMGSPAPQPGIEPVPLCRKVTSQPLDHQGSPQVVISVFLEASIISEQVSTLDHQWGGKQARSCCIDLQ